MSTRVHSYIFYTLSPHWVTVKQIDWLSDRLTVLLTDWLTLNLSNTPVPQCNILRGSLELYASFFKHQFFFKVSAVQSDLTEYVSGLAWNLLMHQILYQSVVASYFPTFNVSVFSGAIEDVIWGNIRVQFPKTKCTFYESVHWQQMAACRSLLGLANDFDKTRKACRKERGYCSSTVYS